MWKKGWRRKKPNLTSESDNSSDSGASSPASDHGLGPIDCPALKPPTLVFPATSFQNNSSDSIPAIETEQLKALVAT